MHETCYGCKPKPILTDFKISKIELRCTDEHEGKIQCSDDHECKLQNKGWNCMNVKTTKVVQENMNANTNKILFKINGHAY